MLTTAPTRHSPERLDEHIWLITPRATHCAVTIRQARAGPAAASRDAPWRPRLAGKALADRGEDGGGIHYKQTQKILQLGNA